jgi:hypothetical protein
VTIDARRVVRFRASELLLARLNRGTNQRPQRAKLIRARSALMRDPPLRRRYWLTAAKQEGKGAAYEKGQ